MLVYTNLISELEHSFGLIKICNILPLKYPYEVTYQKETKSYTVATNQSFLKIHWKIELFLLTLSSVLGFLRMYLETQNVFDRFTTAYFSGFSLFLVLTGMFQKREAKSFAQFLNELGEFEKRHGLLNLPKISCKTVTIACNQLSQAMFNQAFLYSFSCALFPTVAWNVIPTAIYNVLPKKFSGALFGNQWFYLGIVEVPKRVLIFLYLYITNKVLTNFATINVVINLLISTYCLNATLRVVKR